MTSPRKTLAAVSMAAALAAAGAAPVAAHDSGHGNRHGNERGTSNRTTVYRAHLNPLNDSGATGVAKLRLKGTTLHVKIRARGLVPNQPHAQHIHGIGNSECPTMADAGGDGLLTTSEGLPFYGPIAVSLTTKGSVSPAQGLDLAMMPVADADGRINYRRSFQIPSNVAANLGGFQIVQHGIDANGNGVYDFESLGASELNSAFPQEGTAPANCGTIDRMGQHKHGR
jgi:hypothetical protein